MGAPPEEGPIRMLYISGWGRSGTTIVDKVIGGLPGLTSVGELRSLWDVDPSVHLCGCGVVVSRCPFWGEVLRETNEGRLLSSFASARRLRDEATRFRRITGLLSDAGHGGSARSEYGNLIANIYARASALTGGAMVVDSSKHPADALLLASRPDIDVTVLHLVRDPRAVAYSWRRSRHSPTRAVGEPPTRGLISSSAWWLTWNALAEWVLSPRMHGRFMTVRYEDLMSSPRAQFEAIAERIGADPHDLPFSGTDEVELVRSHTVAGNPNRMQAGAVRLTLDREWVTAMTKTEKLMATIPAAPLMLHLRYPLRFPRSTGLEDLASVLSGD